MKELSSLTRIFERGEDNLDIVLCYSDLLYNV